VKGKELQRPFFTCFFGHGQKACAQPSQGVSELLPEKNGLAIELSQEQPLIRS
jgi:hypothetical protein